MVLDRGQHRHDAAVLARRHVRHPDPRLRDRLHEDGVGPAAHDLRRAAGRLPRRVQPVHQLDPRLRGRRADGGARDPLRLRRDVPRLRHRLRQGQRHVKASYYEEDSNISETGLGEIDYANDKFQAPSGKNDHFKQERKTLQLQHVFQIDNTTKLSTQAYYADTYRTSFRQTDAPGGFDDAGNGFNWRDCIRTLSR